MIQGESISVRIVQKVAAREGVDPTTLTPPLEHVVDTDALDALFRPTDRGRATAGTVEFGYRDYAVTVDASGDIRLTETSSSPEARSQQVRDVIGD